MDGRDVERYGGTIMVAKWLELAMPTTLTLKNIPDDLYERLRAAAKAHRRSLNSEAIGILEAALLPTKRITVEERIERIRRLRESLPGGGISHEEIDVFIEEGRP